MTALRGSIELALVALFLLLGALHVYWAFGGRWGAVVAIPEVDGKPAFRPGRAATLVVALLLATAAAVIAGRSCLLPSDGFIFTLVHLGTWTLGTVFVLRAIGNFDTFGFFKARRATAFARYDTRLFSPLCLAIGVGCFLVALGP
jgi:hypothetical protein